MMQKLNYTVAVITLFPIFVRRRKTELLVGGDVCTEITSRSIRTVWMHVHYQVRWHLQHAIITKCILCHL